MKYLKPMVGTRQFDEEILLEAALKAFWQNGFAATSMIDVAEATGVQRGSLYNAYGDKERLFLLAFERYSSRFTEALKAIDQRERDPLAKLEAYAKIYADVLSERRMCLCGMLAAGYDTLPAPMQEAVIDFFDVNEAWLTRVLDRGVAEGELVLSGSSAEAAQAIVSGLEGAMLIARPYDDVKRFDTAASRLMRSLVRAAPASVTNR